VVGGIQSGCYFGRCTMLECGSVVRMENKTNIISDHYLLMTVTADIFRHRVFLNTQRIIIKTGFFVFTQFTICTLLSTREAVVAQSV
jgi:hypothetical protein